MLDLSAQEGQGSQLRDYSLVVKDSLLVKDSLTIVPHSVVLTVGGDTLPTTAYRIRNAQLVLSPVELYLGQDLHLRYRTFAFDIGQRYFRIDTAALTRRDVTIYIGYDYRPYRDDPDALFQSNDLNYSGSFSRGFSVGNSQSFVLNSNFNLQLAGKFGDDLKILAAISDDNIPIQPEGNTQILQEFDKVYIQVSKDRTSVTAGDYNLLNPKGYFQRYNKRLKGLSGTNTIRLNEFWDVTNKASAAAARGKFARQTLATREGNQGPYKLIGNNGERFLIIQSGSERVYLDGRLLKRGFEYDYTIDYNRAEITFTPTQVVKVNDRFVVEFEYADQNYLRTVYATETRLHSAKGSAYVHLYSEQDSKNATGDIVLDSTDISRLASAGDSQSDAVRSGIRRITALDADARPSIRYRKEWVDGDSILIYDPAGDFAAYFSEVGAGQGDYAIASDLGVNGRAYKYVGVGMGSYMPNIRLVPPQQFQMMSLGGDYRWQEHGGLAAELSMSRFDFNRYSPVDNEDNNGLAGFLQAQQRWHLGSDSTWVLASSAKVELVEKDFNILNPYRDQEFLRDWNILGNAQRRDEQLYRGGLTLSKAKQHSLGYQYSGLRRANAYAGDKHVLRWQSEFSGWQFDVVGNLLTTQSDGLETSFARPKITLGKQLGQAWRVSWYTEVESNRIREEGGSDLLSSSFQYDLSRLRLEGGGDGVLSLALEASLRRDKRVEVGGLVPVSCGQTLSLSSAYRPSEQQQLEWSVAARRLEVERPDLIDQQAKTTLLGKLDYSFALAKGLLRSSTAYNLDSGQEPKLEFVYFRLENADQGEYVYIGEDDQGLDQSKFVFDPGNPLAFYRRTTQFNNDFILTNNQSINQSLRIDLSRLWSRRGKPAVPQDSPDGQAQSGISKKKKEPMYQNIIKRFSSISNLRFTKKVADEGSDASIRFASFDLGDTSLISGTRLLTNTLFFNQGNPLYDIQLGNRLADNKVVQVSGFELRTSSSVFGRLRFNLKKYIDFILQVEQGSNGSDSELFDNRDFDISYTSINPMINYRPTSSMRFSLAYDYGQKQQEIGNLESASSHDVTLGFSYRRATSESLDLKFSLVNIDFDGPSNTVLEFEMLESLKPGRNGLWSINFIKRLSNSIDLNLNYEGRKTGDSPVLHVARAQVKATF